MFCEKCGTNNKEGARFCAGCGSVLPEQAPEQDFYSAPEPQYDPPQPQYSAPAGYYAAPGNRLQPKGKKKLSKLTFIMMIVAAVSSLLAATLPYIPLYVSVNYQKNGKKEYYNVITNCTRFFTKNFEHSDMLYEGICTMVLFILASCVIVAGIVLFFLKLKASPAVLLGGCVLIFGEMYAFFKSWWAELIYVAGEHPKNYEFTMTVVPFFALFFAAVGIFASAFALAKFRKE